MLTYKHVYRKNPVAGTVLYCAQLLPVTPVGIAEISRDISDECTITEHDIRGVVSALEEQVFKALRNGRSVRLGQLGSFCPTVISKGVKEEKDFVMSNITGIHVCFRPSTTMRHELSVKNGTVKLRCLKEKPQVSA